MLHKILPRLWPSWILGGSDQQGAWSGNNAIGGALSSNADRLVEAPTPQVIRGCQASQGEGLTSGNLWIALRIYRSSEKLMVYGLGARLRGRMATQRSKKGSEKVLGSVLGMGSEHGTCNTWFTVTKGSEKGSQKSEGVLSFQKVPGTPPRCRVSGNLTPAQRHTKGVSKIGRERFPSRPASVQMGDVSPMHMLVVVRTGGLYRIHFLDS